MTDNITGLDLIGDVYTPVTLESSTGRITKLTIYDVEKGEILDVNREYDVVIHYRGERKSDCHFGVNGGSISSIDSIKNSAKMGVERVKLTELLEDI